ncbi:hypothetical protein PQ478_18770 [Alkalihalophilus pseudofirmus]|uniref:hypothetical protein n=1 Tax=Alkalihalophilus pseudofirmus TaxID=79885 RepID=UPI00259B7913|nr:hypothetical protein [Alkalihalophilus pseudofirmus]WEG16521.1 hypothetical protein PQ478_18770 [Alkalihalophilus pseudofirmus]
MEKSLVCAEQGIMRWREIASVGDVIASVQMVIVSLAQVIAPLQGFIAPIGCNCAGWMDYCVGLRVIVFVRATIAPLDLTTPHP